MTVKFPDPTFKSQTGKKWFHIITFNVITKYVALLLPITKFNLLDLQFPW
jgi:hypothetical protein